MAEVISPTRIERANRPGPVSVDMHDLVNNNGANVSGSDGSGGSRHASPSPSPRCEAFVMTGDKMLRLNSKISPNYAKLKSTELPVTAEVLEPLDENGTPQRFEHHVMAKGPRSKRRIKAGLDPGYIVESQSAHAMNCAERMLPGEDDDSSSCVTVNAGAPMSAESGQGDHAAPPQWPADSCQSAPCSPAKPSVQQLQLLDSEGEIIPEEPTAPVLQKLPAQDSTASSSVPSTSANIDHAAASRLAKRLYLLQGFRKGDVAKHLTKNNDFSRSVATEFVDQFEFAGLRLDAALRLFLTHFSLVGETSEREHIVELFSRRYHVCNPGQFENTDAVHLLACSLLLLNNDLHGQAVDRKMSCRKFVDNVTRVPDGANLQRFLLKQLYGSIRDQPLPEATASSSDSGTADSGLGNGGRALVKRQTVDQYYLEIPDPDSQVEHKKGYVMRKCVVEPDGKVTPKGKRGWKMFYATLKGLILYLHRDETGFRKGSSSFQTFHNCIRVHHALATRAVDYTKKQHVFRLQTAHFGEYLFQTSEPAEVQSWIEQLNFVAASFSCPPLAAGVGSKQSGTFHRPLLPAQHSTLKLPEQLREHEARIVEVEDMLERHRQTAPSRTARPKAKQEYAEVEIYLQGELTRYKTYVYLLRSKLEDLMTHSEYSTTTATLPLYQQHNMIALDQSSNITLTSSNGPQPGGAGDRLSYKAAIYHSTNTTSSYESSC